ncbi:MAG: hypothetical protein A3F18_00250 [Legionellales bacterium RIFCSPHIGHO2_12_FULL_37_14]|nr:MAG: hypothetical protein A3F18_00250 [Legionellales bacterium RIFCSPHIGHO2_12_FULL_37_14]
MNLVLTNITNDIAMLTLNRPLKNNAFDGQMMQELTTAIHQAEKNSAVKVIVLQGEGKHFSAGADLKWMQQMAASDYAANKQDALLLAELLFTLSSCTKPTIAQVKGASYGGGIGLIAACDIAVAADSATFCFSEVRLGLLPAVISPYVVQAIGMRMAKMLFITGRIFTADEALRINLIHHITTFANLAALTNEITTNICKLPQEAVAACKKLAQDVAFKPIDKKMLDLTATLIAKRRQAKEAKALIAKFLSP